MLYKNLVINTLNVLHNSYRLPCFSELTINQFLVTLLHARHSRTISTHESDNDCIS